MNPYKGLRAFGEGDAHDFFGRAALVEQLLNRLSERDDHARFLALVGPSGSGKRAWSKRVCCQLYVKRGADSIAAPIHCRVVSRRLSV